MIVLYLERVVEDHEIVVDIYCTWPRQNSNTFIFKHLDIKYDLFENPIVSQLVEEIVFIIMGHVGLFSIPFIIEC